MVNIIRFFAESILISAALYLLYIVLFRGKATYLAQRVMLLSIPLIASLASAISWDLIAVKVDNTSKAQVESIQTIYALPESKPTAKPAEAEQTYHQTEGIEQTQQQTPSISTIERAQKIKKWAQILWLSVAALLLTLHLARLRRVVALRSIAEREECPDYTIYRLVGSEMLFSFWRGIYLDREIKQPKLDFVLRHELSHIRKHHYIDKLLIQIYSILLWANPFVRLIEREISLVQEYEADNAVLASGCDAFSYKSYIFEEVTSQTPTFANGLNGSQIKKRFITMKNGYRVSHKVLRALTTTIAMIAVAASSLLYLSAQNNSSLIAALDLEDVETVEVKDGNITVKLKNGNMVVDRVVKEPVLGRRKYPYISGQNRKSIEIDEERLCVVVTLKDDTIVEIPLDDIKLEEIEKVVAPHWVVSLHKKNGEVWVNSDGTWRKKAPSRNLSRENFLRACDHDKNEDMYIVRLPDCTKVYDLLKVRWKTEFFVFGRNIWLIDPNSNKRYQIISVDRGFPIDTVAFIHNRKDEQLYVEMTFPPLDEGVTVVSYNEVADPFITIGYNAVNRGEYQPNVKVTTELPYFVSEEYQAAHE